MNNFTLKMCDIQGRLFELSAKQGYNSEEFISAFMRSRVAAMLDSKYSRMQWAGEEYLLDELLDESDHSINNTNNPFSLDTMYWTGYIYRYWHYYKNEPSFKIYKQAGVKTMKRNYMIFHTFDPELAIDALIEKNKYQ